MSDSENKPTLGRKPLGLKKSVEAGEVKQTFSHGRTNKVVVEVKRRKLIGKPGEAAPAPEPAPEPEPGAHHLGVKAVEFYFLLSRPKVEPGLVTIELNNRGEDAHNLHLQLEGEVGPVLELPETGSLQNSGGEFELSSGTYKLWCSLPEHEEKGMQTTLVVASG